MESQAANRTSRIPKEANRKGKAITAQEVNGVRKLINDITVVAVLADLYSDADYWLTMYGYANYGEIYKSTLGLGDINGLVAVYGP